MPRAPRFRASILLSLALVPALVSCGGGGGHSSNQQTASLGPTVDAVIQTAMEQQGIPGLTVALAKNGAVMYSQGYGKSDLATGQPAQPPLIFEIGSITKQFTAALIMRLQEQGLLHVDDSISLYLPQYNFPSSITLRMMLNHASGLADYTNFPQLGDWVKHGVSEATVLTAVSQAPLQFQPGTRYSYSNSNFFALGAIIEKLTGKSYQDVLNEEILQPLKLGSTFYPLPPASKSATGYTHNGTTLVPAIIWDRSSAFATGALSSNVYDLITWDNALLSGKVVSPESFKAMTTPNGFQIPGGGSYGFGLALTTFAGHPIMWHDGQIGGFTSETVTFLDTSFSVVLLTNDQDANPDQIVLQIMAAVCQSPQFGSNC